MNKKILTPCFSLLIFATTQNVFAHNETPDFEKQKVEREVVSEKKDRDTWDDFMKSVKAQETKKDANTNVDKDADKEKPTAQ